MFYQHSLLFIFIFFKVTLAFASLNDFDLSNSVVPLREFFSGGPQKDGIPSLTNPGFVVGKDAESFSDETTIVGVVIDGEARAYPIDILNWHEIVNDTVAEKPIAVTWCPLTHSAIIFNRQMGETTLEFGVSGLLYNSNVVMYDRNSYGLWSQLKKSGLTGPYAKEQLTMIPSEIVSLKEWKMKYPDTLVLSQKTGHSRDYEKDPYARYHQGGEVMFPLKEYDQRLPLKSLVLGVSIDGKAKAYPLEELQAMSEPFHDVVFGQEISVQISGQDEGAVVLDKDGNVFPSVVAYWFAWSSFNKGTVIYKENSKTKAQNSR